MNALLAVGRGFDALKEAPYSPNEHFMDFTPQLGDVLEKVRRSESDFGEERAAFMEAAQARIGGRPGVLRRVLNRAKRSERNDTDEGKPSADAPDHDDG